MAALTIQLPPSKLKNLPIGIFDSGVGGLTVASALKAKLPRERLLYLGDIARLPYGTKDPRTVVRYALQAGKFLTGRGVKMVVIACNTASAHALDALAAAMAPLPVLGVVEAGAKAAVRSAKGGIVVAATEGTCVSQAFPRAIRADRPDAQVTQVPCPLLVALAEEGMTSGPIAESVVSKMLSSHFAEGAGNDTLLLGCTHFPLLKQAFRAALGPAPTLIDCAEAVAEQTAALLAAKDMATTLDSPGELRTAVTAGEHRFTRLAEALLPDLGAGLIPELVDL